MTIQKWHFVTVTNARETEIYIYIYIFYIYIVCVGKAAERMGMRKKREIKYKIMDKLFLTIDKGKSSLLEEF